MSVDAKSTPSPLDAVDPSKAPIGQLLDATMAPTMAPRPSPLDAVDPSKAVIKPLDATIAPTMAPAIAPMMAPTFDATMAPAFDATMAPRSSAQLSTAVLAPGDVPVIKRAPAALEELVGTELSGYTIKRKLAEGGMGVVFEGEHTKIGRKGAIKVLKLELCRSDEVVERFYQEARAVNAIRHENIVDIYDFGRDDAGRVFFVMEFLQGESLSARIKRGALPWSEAFPILEQILRALKAAHDKGFVHRDLKPDNIWLKETGGPVEVKLLDFGIAKLVGSESPKEKLTQTGSIMGTPHYMSPEQINGSKDVDLRTDIYAMGVITYEMFAGKTPFLGDTLLAIMTGHLFTEPPRLDDVPANLGVPRPIAEVIDRMLVKEADARYASAADVLADLRAIHKNREPTMADALARERPVRAITARPVPARKPVSRKLLAGIGAGVAAAVVAAVVLWPRHQAEPVAAIAAPVVSEPVHVKPAPPPPPPEKPVDFEQVRKDAQTTLRASLREAEPAVRVQGSDALGRIKDQPSVPPLTELTEKDPDAEARGHAADALGQIGATAATALLAKLELPALAPLKVWYAAALARLGDKTAKRRLLAYAGDKDLVVSFKAALALADVSQPGDQDTIKALRVLAGHEQELNNIAPYAGAVILTKMAALHDAKARKLLYGILESHDEGSRLAAAEGLAKLGDDAGKKVLEDVYGNEASPNRLVATVALIPLGDYVGYDLLAAKLADKDPETRRLAARGLGEIGERTSVKPLLAAAGDKGWSVRIAVAVALISIVGLDPQVLAQASVDWTKSALASEDWAVRRSAAGVLGDMAEKDAVPLLASAIADPDPNVRLAASTSSRKMKSAAAATEVATAAKAEKDPKVKEEQVKALGDIGNAAAHDTLVELQADPGRVGVFAAGSLIAVGDPAGKAKLDQAVVAPQVDMRLAAVQSATTAKNPIVVPTLKVGVADKVFEVRFAAAEGLAGFNAEKVAALPVLQDGLASKDTAVESRAESALLKLGEKLGANAPTAAEMIDSPDPKIRLGAIPVIVELPSGEAATLLRRLVTDSDADVRRSGVDAIATLIAKDKDTAIKLYKPLVDAEDQVVRSKAQGQLSRLVDAPKKTAAVAPVTPPTVDDTLPKVQSATAEVTAAATEGQTASDAVDTAIKDITAATAQPAKDDVAIKHVEELATAVDTSAKAAAAAATHTEEAAQHVVEAAGASPPPDAAKLIADAQAAASTARTAATAARHKADAAMKHATDYAKAETEDPQMFVAAADAAIATGNYAEARLDLDKAQKAQRATGAKMAGLDYSYAQLYDKMATREKDPAAKLKLLQQARQSYESFARTGSGNRVSRATDRASELADDIKELGAP